MLFQVRRELLCIKWQQIQKNCFCQPPGLQKDTRKFPTFLCLKVVNIVYVKIISRIIRKILTFKVKNTEVGGRASVDPYKILYIKKTYVFILDLFA